MQSVPDLFLPCLIRLRLVEFASRMPEVKQLDQRDLMADALYEIRRNLVRLLTGGDLTEERPRDDDGEASLRATVALLEDVPVRATEETLETLRGVALALDDMFEGVEFGDEPPVSHCRMRRAS